MRQGVASVEFLGESVVAMGAQARCQPGDFLFPLLKREDDGTIYATFNLRPDSVQAVEIENPVYRYDAASHMWSMAEGVSSHTFGEVTLPDGDKFLSRVVRGAAVETLAMPERCVPAQNWNNWKHYDARAFAGQQPQWWFFSRQPKGQSQWMDEAATVHIPGETRIVREGLLVNSWLRQMVVAPAPGKAGSPAGGVLYGVTFDRRFTDADCTVLQAFNPIQFLESTDGGRTWTMVGEIPYQPDRDADPLWEARMGFNEPWINIMPDGSIVCFIRTLHGNRGLSPMYLARSTNRGRTWSRPRVFDDHGVKPRTLTLGNGATIVSYGRPDVRIAVTRDPGGQEWDAPQVILPGDMKAGIIAATCGYTQMVDMADDAFMLIYSDFNRVDASGERCKAIVTRRMRIDAGAR